MSFCTVFKSCTCTPVLICPHNFSYCLSLYFYLNWTCYCLPHSYSLCLLIGWFWPWSHLQPAGVSGPWRLCRQSILSCTRLYTEERVPLWPVHASQHTTPSTPERRIHDGRVWPGLTSTSITHLSVISLWVIAWGHVIPNPGYWMHMNDLSVLFSIILS